MNNTSNTTDNTQTETLDYTKPENIHDGVNAAINLLRAGKWSGVHRIFDDVSYACRDAGADLLLGVPQIDVSEFSAKLQSALTEAGTVSRIDLINQAISAANARKSAR